MISMRKKYPDELSSRCEKHADHIIGTKETVRQTAKRFGKSKSTVHKDVTSRLYQIDREKWKEVREILEKNKAERHIRGGEATRKKYSLRKKGV